MLIRCTNSSFMLIYIPSFFQWQDSAAENFWHLRFQSLLINIIMTIFITFFTFQKIKKSSSLCKLVCKKCELYGRTWVRGDRGPVLSAHLVSRVISVICSRKLARRERCWRYNRRRAGHVSSYFYVQNRQRLVGAHFWPEIGPSSVFTWKEA